MVNAEPTLTELPIEITEESAIGGSIKIAVLPTPRVAFKLTVNEVSPTVWLAPITTKVSPIATIGHWVVKAIPE